MNTEIGNGRELMKVEQSCRQLSEANSLEAILEIRDEAVAFRYYAENIAKSREMQNEAAEIWLRSERRAGQFLPALHLRGGNRRSKSHAESLKLGGFLIDRNESFRCQQLAAIPDPIFEGYFRESNKTHLEVTRASLIRYARKQGAKWNGQDPGRNGHFRGELTPIRKALCALANGPKRFSGITVFPPWPKMRHAGENVRSRPRLQRFRSELEQLPLPELIVRDAHVHLATTSDRLDDGIRVLRAWKVPYRSILICVRPHREYGPYWCSTQTFLLLGSNGHSAFRRREFQSVIETDRNEMTPDMVRPWIERVSRGPYLEVNLIAFCNEAWRGSRLSGPLGQPNAAQSHSSAMGCEKH